MIKKLTAENFEAEVLKAKVPILVDFYADWCGPCRMMAPVLEEIAGEMEGKLDVGKLNVDENQEIAARYKVMSIPMMIVFRNGEAAAATIGRQSKEDLMAEIERVL
jgi:thioredoxin 1